MKLYSKKDFMLLLAIIALIGFAIIAVFYSQKTKSNAPADTFGTEIENIERQSDSDKVEDIESDLLKTDLDNVDKELQDIETELNSSY